MTASTPSPDDERKALVWLETVISDPNAFEDARDNARTLRAMLTKTLYRIRAQGLDLIHEGPISISEVPL
jgi:hypothetical protein